MTKEMKLFVYGSLRENFFNYDIYLKGQVIESQIGKIKGKLYHMPNKGYPAVVEGTDDVYGEIISIKNFHENLESMDKMEGFIGEGHPNNEYNRVIVDVELVESGGVEQAYSYIYNLPHEEDFKTHSEYVPHGDWKKHMLK